MKIGFNHAHIAMHPPTNARCSCSLVVQFYEVDPMGSGWLRPMWGCVNTLNTKSHWFMVDHGAKSLGEIMSQALGNLGEWSPPMFSRFIEFGPQAGGTWNAVKLLRDVKRWGVQATKIHPPRLFDRVKHLPTTHATPFPDARMPQRCYGWCRPMFSPPIFGLPTFLSVWGLVYSWEESQKSLRTSQDRFNSADMTWGFIIKAGSWGAKLRIQWPWWPMSRTCQMRNSPILLRHFFEYSQ